MGYINANLSTPILIRVEITKPRTSAIKTLIPAFILLTFCSACATSLSAARVESAYLGVLLAPPDNGLAPLSRFAPSKASSSKPKSRSHARPLLSTRRNVQTDFAQDFLSDVGDLSLRRSEMVGSAKRLLGIKDSFDQRSFIGHILYVNDLLPSGAQADSFQASQLLSLAQARGRLVRPDVAMPGDIVLFRCDKGCGAGSEDGLAGGVVIRAYSQQTEFICYIDSKVQACHHGERSPRLPSRRVKEIVAIVSLGHAQSGPEEARQQ